MSKLGSPLPKDNLCHGPVVVEKKMKSFDNADNDANDDDNGDDGQRKNCDQKSSLEPSAKVS